MPGLDFDPRSKGHGQLFNFSGPLLFSDFQSKGVKWGDLQILCTKVPGHTHWKTNTPEFVLSTMSASVKCVHVTHMLNGREDRMWVIRWDDRRQELSGEWAGDSGLCKGVAAPEATRTWVSCWQCPFPAVHLYLSAYILSFLVHTPYLVQSFLSLLFLPLPRWSPQGPALSEYLISLGPGSRYITIRSDVWNI